MKAFTKKVYGGPEVLQLEEVAKPALKDDELLIKVIANSANPADWHILRGEPVLARFAFGLLKPAHKILGGDFAGIVVKKGSKVRNFSIDDHVFGKTSKGGAFAEYVCVTESQCSKMPAGSSFAEMAAVPIAGLTAFQAVVTHGKLNHGESVLINGSSGGVGHIAVQIAKAYGGNVTAVCSSKNADFVKSLGADKVIAHDKENIHKHTDRYNLVIDTHGNLSHSDFLRMGERGVVVGFTTMWNMIALSITGKLKKSPITHFTADTNKEDLQKLASLIQSGKLKIHLEKIFPYKEIPEAIGYIEAMQTRGKVAMVWEKADN